MFQTIEECIQYIENQIPQKIDLSLDRIEQAAQILGNPQTTYQTIHITGTNGKGSTSSFTNQLLQSQGLKVGLFTSPHLQKYNERIRVNDTLISDCDFIEQMKKIVDVVLPCVQLTIFECLTLAAYQYFADQKIDVAVIEVGLGGRFDATNIITPKVACVTNISIDHVQFLSDDPIKIAYEKAGIFKTDSLNFHTVDDLKLHSILNQEQESVYIRPFISYKATRQGFDIDISHNSFQYKGCFPMYGIHQIRNLEAALEITIAFLKLANMPLNVEVMGEQIQRLSWKGRMEQLIDHVYFDGAHNVAGIQSLNQVINTHFQNEKIDVIFSVMKDKNVEQMLQMLIENANINHIYFLALPFDRALQSIPDIFVSSPKISAIDFDTLPLLTNESEITIFAGSLYGYEKIVELIAKVGD